MSSFHPYRGYIVFGQFKAANILSLKRLNNFKRDRHHSCSLPVSPWDQRGHCSLFRLKGSKMVET